MKVYVDNEFKCHITNPDGIYKEVEVTFFDGKCQTFVEGYCYDDSKSYTPIYPWKPYSELAAAQDQYEIMLADMDAAYQEGVQSVW